MSIAQARTRSVGGHHQRQQANWTDDWQTPPAIIEALGSFDLDPCASVSQRHRTAKAMLTIEDGNFSTWCGRVWLSPPYGRTIDKWMQRMAEHDHGTALVFARTDTAWFQTYVFGRAKALLFLAGRLSFIRPDGSTPKHNSGGPSVLIAYGNQDANCLLDCDLKGARVQL